MHALIFIWKQCTPHSFSPPYSWGERVNPTLFSPSYSWGERVHPPLFFPIVIRWEKKSVPPILFFPIVEGEKVQKFYRTNYFHSAQSVIYMQDCHLLIEPMCLQEKVKQTDNVVCTFPTLSSLVSEKVDLGLTVYPKHSTLPWC